MAISLINSFSASSSSTGAATTTSISYTTGDFFVACVGTANTTNTVSGGGLTWTKLGSYQGDMTIWTATAGSTSSGTVSVSSGSLLGVLLTVTQFSGASSITTTADASALTVNLNTTANNSWVWCFTYSVTGGTATATAGTGQTIQTQLDNSAVSNWGAALSKQNSTTPTSGTTVTSNMTSTASSTKSIVAFEILASGAAGTMTNVSTMTNVNTITL